MWDKLSMKEKTDIISLGIENNITNLEDIKNIYNSSIENNLDIGERIIENNKDSESTLYDDSNYQLLENPTTLNGNIDEVSEYIREIEKDIDNILKTDNSTLLTPTTGTPFYS